MLCITTQNPSTEPKSVLELFNERGTIGLFPKKIVTKKYKFEIESQKRMNTLLLKSLKDSKELSETKEAMAVKEAKLSFEERWSEFEMQ